MSSHEVACAEIERNAQDLNTLSQDIWSHPELNFEEKHAHSVLTAFLEEKGFSVERSYKLDTAFKAVCGEEGKGPNVTIISEYDALPGIGHACGHNLIAEVGVAAGLGVKAAFHALGKPVGKLTVLGTPAEEGGGGKIDLIRAGVFDDCDVALMAHPTPFVLSSPSLLSFAGCSVKYHGKASHAAGFPWDGVNALDAAILCYQNISCLRQQFKPTWRVHGIISNGGAKPNIIPDLTQLEYYCRASSDSEINVLKQKLVKCFESAAQATGCTVEHEFNNKSYSSLISNSTLVQSYVKNAESLGMVFTPPEVVAGKPLGSTDMGNVSHVVPSIHPMFYVGRDAVNHTREFTDAAGAPEAQPHTLQASKALAMTAIDVFTSPDMLEKIKQDFKKDTENP